MKNQASQWGDLPLLVAITGLLWLATSCREDPSTSEDFPLSTDQAQAEPEDIGSPTWPSKVPDGKIHFKKHVRPILVVNCLECHNNEKAAQNGNLSLETRKMAMTTGINPPVLKPGDPDGSLLIQVLKNPDAAHHRAMPPTPDKIWGIRMEILRRWIAEGADWPTNVPLEHPADVKEW